MAESVESSKTPNRGNAVAKRSLAASRRVSVLIVLLTTIIAALVILQDRKATSKLREQILEENRLRMLSSLEHVEEYFGSIYSTLLFISLDKDVAALRRDSREFIEKLYLHEWEQHRLTEIYVVERGFDGRQQPMMTFERESAEMPLDRVHSPEREQEEYRTQIEQIQQFADRPDLRALLSREISLCTPDAQGGLCRGYVYSVPIRAQDRFVGIVSGMVATETIMEALRRGTVSPTRVLVSERGDYIASNEVGRGFKEWLQQQFGRHGVAGFFSRASASFEVGDKHALWTPAQIVSGEKWWLVCLYDLKTQLPRTSITGVLGHFLVAGSLLLSGIALAFLVRSLGRRLDEQVRHLEERKQLERQVEEVSEREQRRIGASLHEDLCQRLTGIEAISRHLEKRLGKAGLPEADAAADIAAEIKESLTRARQMADELQPVSLLEHGLLAALHELSLNTSQHRGIPCAVENAGFAAKLNPTIASHLYRIAQEAINNAVQHANASRIVIRLATTGKDLTMSIIDNGTGFGAGAASGERVGMGLLIMRYRSELIGGRLEFRPGPAGGTLVQCTFPIAGQQ